MYCGYFLLKTKNNIYNNHVFKKINKKGRVLEGTVQ